MLNGSSVQVKKHFVLVLVAHGQKWIPRCLRFVGVCWAELAQKGHDWRNAKRTYLQHVGVLYEHRDDVVQWDRIFLRNISNKYRSFLGARYMPCQARLVHIVDSAQVCNQTLGFGTVAKTSPWYAFVKSLRWSLYALEHQWRFVAGTTEGHILIHRARAFNTHADFYANAVLDLNVDCTEFIIPFNLGPNSIVVISSDGASRDNPGRASASAVVQVCEGSELTVVAYRAVFIGIATSTQAEFEAACLAHCLLVDWCIASGIVQV